MSVFFSTALLIEDEVNLNIALKIALRKLGITSQSASTLREATALLQQTKPELILLDRCLPDGDGLELCSQLRAEGYSGTILILTASGNVEDRVHGLNAGADDYLPKPFSWEELDARIKALSRRKITYTTRLNTWTIDESKLAILGPKGWIQLTPLEFKLASQLLQKPRKIISRNELLKEVWGFTLLPKTRTVDHFMGRLRKYFETNPEDPHYFLTIRGAGYLFQPDQN